LSTLETTSTETLQKCAKACKEQYGVQLKFGRADGANAGQCTCYREAQCVAGGAEDLNNDVYTVENPCYWTEPLLVHTDSTCENISEMNLDDGMYGSGTQFAMDYTSHTYTLNQCHQLCQEDGKC
jgi:hypothetical protein